MVPARTPIEDSPDARGRGTLARFGNDGVDVLAWREPGGPELDSLVFPCESPLEARFIAEDRILARCGSRVDLLQLGAPEMRRALRLPAPVGLGPASATAGLFTTLDGRVAEMVGGRHRADVAAPICFGPGGRTLIDEAGIWRVSDGSRLFLFILHTSAGMELAATSVDGKLEASDRALAEIPWTQDGRRLTPEGLAKRRVSGLVEHMLQ